MAESTFEPDVNGVGQLSPEVAQEQKDVADELLNFTTARIHIKRLVDDWSAEVSETALRRAERDVNINVEALRQQGKLDNDETLIPVRVIDTNIQREQPAYVNYLKNSRRICTFNSLTNPEQDTQQLEQEFTRGMTYIGWEKQHYKNVDGAQTHGWDAIEVVEDASKPLGVGLEHIGHDKLYFPTTSVDIQFAARLIRRYEMTLLQLDKFTKAYGWAADQVQKLKDNRKSTAKELEVIQIYKQYCKKEGVIYVSWFCLCDGVDNWLKAPVVYDLKLINPVTGEAIPTGFYPIFILPYRESEKPQIMMTKGRCHYDRNKQEAQTSILSAYTNGLNRASQVFASPKKEDSTGAAIKELDIPLPGGRILSQPIEFWHPDYPDPSVLTALQYFDVSNSQETNQPNFAVNNRQDSRKTATEIQSANQQQQLLNSVQLTMFSTFVREVYNCVWLMVQSKAIRGEIQFMVITTQIPVINPATQQPMLDPMTQQPMTQPQRTNNLELLKQLYDVRAAGDVDVIQRQEQLQQMMNDWPVVANTPLASVFLQDMLRLKYPAKGDSYAQIIAGQGGLVQQLQANSGRLATILQGAIQQHPDMLTTLPPEQQADVQKLVEQSLAMAQQQQPPMQ